MPGTGGRVGAKGATLSQYVAQSIATRKPDPYETDPRQAILRHAKDAEENPYWVDKAYTKWVIDLLVVLVLVVKGFVIDAVLVSFLFFFILIFN